LIPVARQILDPAVSLQVTDLPAAEEAAPVVMEALLNTAVE
jgi:hypothetical protein